MKTMKRTLNFEHGVKVTVECPYTVQDALGEFKAGVKKHGGTVTKVQDELTISGLSAVDLGTLSHKLTEDLRAAENVSGTHSEQLDFADFSGPEDRAIASMFGDGNGPFSWPSFIHLGARIGHLTSGRQCGKSEVARAMAEDRGAVNRRTKAELVKDVAPKALSTWEFSQEYLDRVYGTKVHVVGQHYRPKRAQEVIGYKKQGNMALLVAEPDNPVDLNSIMVFMWEDKTKSWQHVGYVRATEAALLRSKWVGDFKRPMVSRITKYPSRVDGHRGGHNIELTLTGEVRSYPGYKL